MIRWSTPIPGVAPGGGCAIVEAGCGSSALAPRGPAADVDGERCAAPGGCFVQPHHAAPSAATTSRIWNRIAGPSESTVERATLPEVLRTTPFFRSLPRPSHSRAPARRLLVGCRHAHARARAPRRGGGGVRLRLSATDRRAPTEGRGVDRGPLRRDARSDLRRRAARVDRREPPAEPPLPSLG